jgi:hypothetical protein
MIPFLTRKPRKLYKDYKIMTLASRHGDGRFVGKVMEKFGFISILGSTKRSKKSSRGIEISSLREILRGLKKGHSLGITPDGPRGPNQKISGELINLAKLSGAEILPVSQTTSNFIQFNSWDKFKFPLPFSKICFYFAEETIKVSKNLDQKELDDIAQLAEDKMNLVQENSQIRAL